MRLSANHTAGSVQHHSGAQSVAQKIARHATFHFVEHLTAGVGIVDKHCPGAAIMFGKHIAALPDVMRSRAAYHFLNAAILLIVGIGRRRAAIHTDDAVDRIVSITVNAVVGDIAVGVIGIIHRCAAVGDAG